MEKMENIVGEAEEARGLAPIVVQRYMQFTLSKVKESLEAEFTLKKRVYKEIVSLEKYGEVFEKTVELGTEILVTQKSIPYGFLLTESEAVFVAYRNGTAEACIISESPGRIRLRRECILRLQERGESYSRLMTCVSEESVEWIAGAVQMCSLRGGKRRTRTYNYSNGVSSDIK